METTVKLITAKNDTKNDGSKVGANEPSTFKNNFKK